MLIARGYGTSRPSSSQFTLTMPFNPICRKTVRRYPPIRTGRIGCRAQKVYLRHFVYFIRREKTRLSNKKWEVEFVCWIVWAVSALLKPKASLMVENLCLRQQLLVLQRRSPRLRLRNADRRFMILACRWFRAADGSFLGRIALCGLGSPRILCWMRSRKGTTCVRNAIALRGRSPLIS